MAQSKAKLISLEEGAFALFLVLLAFACLIVAGKTYDQVMAFHTAIGALFAAAGAFIIFKNYFDDGGIEITEPILITEGGVEKLSTLPGALFIKT